MGTFFGRQSWQVSPSKSTNACQPSSSHDSSSPLVSTTTNLGPVVLWSGILPFSTLFVELFFTYSSVFHYKVLLHLWICGIGPPSLRLGLHDGERGGHVLLPEQRILTWTSFKMGFGVQKVVLTFFRVHFE